MWGKVSRVTDNSSYTDGGMVTNIRCGGSSSKTKKGGNNESLKKKRGSLKVSVMRVSNELPSFLFCHSLQTDTIMRRTALFMLAPCQAPVAPGARSAHPTSVVAVEPASFESQMSDRQCSVERRVVATVLLCSLFSCHR